jgi:magnesium-transporting ATPase (P-type)
MAESTCRILNLAIVMNSMANPKFIEDRGKTLKIEHIGNKTESALLEMAYRMGYNYERFRINSKVKRIYSTTPPKKKMATIYKD